MTALHEVELTAKRRLANAPLRSMGKDAERWSLAELRDLAKLAAGDDADHEELVG